MMIKRDQRLIREVVDARAIFPYDPSAAPKLMKYVPWWAVPQSEDRRS